MNFLRKFPDTGYWIMAAMLAVIVFMTRAGLDNNTKAMDRLTGSIDNITTKVGNIEVNQGKFAVILDNHEKRLCGLEK